jgi:hypothetical protein
MWHDWYMRTIEDIKKRNREVGHHFFDSETMSFFASRIYPKVFGDYFVTSEQFPAGPRRYSVRRMDWDTGAIETVGLFQQFTTLAEAMREAKELATQHQR